MIANAEHKSERPGVVVIDIGNTSIAVGAWDDGQVSQVSRTPTWDGRAFAAAFDCICGSLHQGRPTAIVVGSVVPAALDRVVACVKETAGLDARIVGADVALPIDVDLQSPETVGVDRVCCAAAAFDRVRQACIVVDFGSAVTVDVVGDDGRFLGGAILPGARMQARALSEFAAKLPRAEVRFPSGPIGRDTISAIQSGICHGIVGAVRGIVEAVATDVGKWPQVVGTGGDLAMFTPHCDFLDSAVPDLCLMGIGLAWIRQTGKSG